MRIGNQATKRPIARLWACRLLPRSPNAVATFSLFKDRKSTRLNSSHSQISYAVFCLKQKLTTSGSAFPRCSAEADRRESSTSRAWGTLAPAVAEVLGEARPSYWTPAHVSESTKPFSY